MSLVESWPSTEMRSNERFTHTPSSRSAVSGASPASVWTKHSIVAKLGEIIPAPLACAVMRTVPLGSVTSTAARLGNRSVVRIDSPNASSPVSDSSPRAARMPLMIGSVGQRHADHAGRGDRDDLRVEPQRHRGGALHAGGVVDPAPPGGRVGVAGVGDHRAQRVERAALLAQDHRARRARRSA